MAVRPRGKTGRGGALVDAVPAAATAPAPPGSCLPASPSPHAGGTPATGAPGPDPTPAPFGFLVELLDRIAPMGIAGQLVHCGRSGQVAPVVFPLLGLLAGGTLSNQPVCMPRPIAGAPPPAHGDTLLAQSAFGSLPPVDRAPLGAGHCLQALI